MSIVILCLSSIFQAALSFVFAASAQRAEPVIRSTNNVIAFCLATSSLSIMAVALWGVR